MPGVEGKDRGRFCQRVLGGLKNTHPKSLVTLSSLLQWGV